MTGRPPTPPVAASVAFSLTAATGVAIGWLVSVPAVDSGHQFNWLAFMIFTAAAFVSATVAWAGATVARHLWVAPAPRPTAAVVDLIDPPHL